MLIDGFAFSENADLVFSAREEYRRVVNIKDVVDTDSVITEKLEGKNKYTGKLKTVTREDVLGFLFDTMPLGGEINIDKEQMTFVVCVNTD